LKIENGGNGFNSQKWKIENAGNREVYHRGIYPPEAWQRHREYRERFTMKDRKEMKVVK